VVSQAEPGGRTGPTFTLPRAPSNRHPKDSLAEARLCRAYLPLRRCAQLRNQLRHVCDLLLELPLTLTDTRLLSSCRLYLEVHVLRSNGAILPLRDADVRVLKHSAGLE
jgi:hypothetical protein